MSIEYTGKINIEEKINGLIEEMKSDNEFIYTIQVYESRKNDKISKLLIEVSDINTPF